MLTSRVAAAAPAAHGIFHGSIWGYVGAQDRHLQKYAQTLHALHVPLVLRRTAPTLSAFLAPAHLRALAEEWLLTLQREAPGRPGIAWLLSNGGAFVYQHALALLRADAALPPPSQRFPGVSFAALALDSAPVFVDARSSGTALSTALGLRQRPLLRACTHAAVRALFSFNNTERTNTEFFAALALDVGGLPGRAPPRLLLACSADDAITDLARVQAFAAQCAAAGRAVELWTVPSPSPHCTHLLTHRQEYQARLGALLAAAAPPPLAAGAGAGAGAAPRMA
jgi:hypothetical protein